MYTCAHFAYRSKLLSSGNGLWHSDRGFKYTSGRTALVFIGQWARPVRVGSANAPPKVHLWLCLRFMCARFTVFIGLKTLTRTHACTHAHTHVRAHTRTHTRAHTHARARARAHTHAHAHARARARTHTKALVHVHTYACAHTHMCCDVTC